MGAKTSQVVRRLSLHAPNVGGPGLIPGQGTMSHKPQRRVHTPQPRSSAFKERKKIMGDLLSNEGVKTWKLRNYNKCRVV